MLLPNRLQNKKYTFYYDESNNVRKLALSDKIDGYNIEHDEDKYSSFNFVLGGVAHLNDSSTADFDALKKSIMLQPTANEIKRDHLATGDFIFMLNSRKLKGMFEWLLQSDLYVQYFNLNMEYWAYLDIIEDCVLFCLEKNLLSFHSKEHCRHYQDVHKDELYKIVSSNREKFIRFLKSYDYPYFTGKEKSFLKELHDIVLDHYNTLLYKPLATQDEKLHMNSLRELLEMCIENEMDDFTLTTDFRFEAKEEKPKASEDGDQDNSSDNYLVDAFALFYRYRGMDFPNSKHIFDVEEVVKESFESSLPHDEELAKLDYQFDVSHDNLFIQVSDVVAGVFQKYFAYLNANRIEDIKNVRDNLNPIQKANLELFRKLINKSDSENKQLLFYVMSMREYEKHYQFTFA
ncbi:hypothetical protein J8V57_01470 [Xenorhabdus sp. PB61.4]|uniref:DUF3800 domain-containing protein n=1 Tax=Xenorhabdus sp. PB61.4 TaxID=2788940 RepID=UPI001E59994B|nr:DUF3800 domain-containing protein [Xenorhabdus sp. PB61.4]MCC8364960.1 hypothetical protein [Xenorhabdus sp. PB61.4]